MKRGLLNGHSGIARRAVAGRRLEAARDLGVWREALAGLDWVSLRTSAVYYGFGVPRGHGSGVILVPGFLGTDRYLMEMYYWLERVGYRPFYSGIGRINQCPDVLSRRLAGRIDRAYRETGGKVALVGHSLGGVLARSAARQRPRRVSQIITLGSPLTSARVHPAVLAAASVVRRNILGGNGNGNGHLPRPETCYTDACSCRFVRSIDDEFPADIDYSAVYTKADGVVDWECCRGAGRCRNIEVKGTHIGLAFNPQVYRIIARLLAGAEPS